jgi:hypothetical protein
MPNQFQCVRQTAAALMVYGLIASVLPGFAAASAGPEWSWGLPVYQIATRYYNEIGGFKEIEKDIPRLKSLHVGIIYLMPVHPCSEDASRDAQMRGNNYQTVDYQGVNPAMGSLQDYKDLVKALHANGMYVIQGMGDAPTAPPGNAAGRRPTARGRSCGHGTPRPSRPARSRRGRPLRLSASASAGSGRAVPTTGWPQQLCAAAALRFGRPS